MALFNQAREKMRRVKRAVPGRVVGQHRMLIDRRTGRGIFSSIRGFLGKVYKAVAPVVNNVIKTVAPTANQFLDSGKAQELTKQLINTGANKLGDVLTKKFGKSEKRDEILKNLADKGSEAISTKGTELARKLLDQGLSVGNKKKEGGNVKLDARISRILKGTGLQHF